jgi:V8-like Glu-specific endopeptidase
MIKNISLFILIAFTPVFFVNAQITYNQEYIRSHLTYEEQLLLQEFPNRDLLTRDSVTFEDATGSFPGVLFLGILGDDNNFLTWCSAALITPKLALTAKHCLRNKNIHELYVKNGPNSPSARGIQVSRVSSSCTDEGWCARTGSLHIPLAAQNFVNTDFASEDIVLLHLESDFIIDSEDYFKLFDDSVDLNSVSMRLAGYPDFAASAGWPQYVSAPVCDYVRSINRTLISNCIPAGGVSGGPLFFTHKGSNYLVGVLSSSIGYLNQKTGEMIAGSRYAPVFGQEFIIEAMESSAFRSGDPPL